LKLDEIVGKKADVVLANALTWREKKGGKLMLEELRKKITHIGVVLRIFANSGNIG
jgi:hypothetical protein